MRTGSFFKLGERELRVPVIGQGTWNLPLDGSAFDEARRSLKLGIDLGMVHIDTAEMYGNGGSENVIGETIKGLPRESLFIVSKVMPSNASYNGTIKACENSLHRLGTDYLDCYLLHWRGSYPLPDTMRALEDLVKQGKIGTLGVSNFDVEDLEEAAACLTREKIACNQVLYNLEERGIERALMSYCKQHSISLVGYTPFGKKRLPDADTESGAVLASIARTHDATVSQIVLAFLVREEGLFAIPKAAREAHVKENAAAGDIVLSESEIKMIDAQFPAPKTRRPLAWS